jgi:hypothetical protein
MPHRFWRNRAGPGEVALITAAITSMSGPAAIKIALATITSNARFAGEEHHVENERGQEICCEIIGLHRNQRTRAVFLHDSFHGACNIFNIAITHVRVDRQRNGPFVRSFGIREIAIFVTVLLAIVRVHV